jgi:hypothetical protein
MGFWAKAHEDRECRDCHCLVVKQHWCVTLVGLKALCWTCARRRGFFLFHVKP